MYGPSVFDISHGFVASWEDHIAIIASLLQAFQAAP